MNVVLAPRYGLERTTVATPILPKHPLPYAPRFTISWRLILVSLAMWALLGYLAWRFF
jgi:hypothetical protein